METNAGDLVTFSIKSNGREIPDTYEVLNIAVKEKINSIPYAIITLRDGDPSSENFPIANQSTFAPGNNIQINAGYDSRNDTIFTGIVTRNSIVTNSKVGSVLKVSCSATALKLARSVQNRNFTNKTDTEIITQLCHDQGLKVNIPATNIIHEKVSQDKISDWEFILDRAAEIGLLVTVADKKMNVAKPAIHGTPVQKIVYGDNLYEMKLTLDASEQFVSTTIFGQDPDGNNLEIQSREVDANSQGNISVQRLAETIDDNTKQLYAEQPASKTALQNQANAALLFSRLRRFSGYVKSIGTSQVKPNSLVTLGGLGARYNGDAFVSGVKHFIGDGNWFTRIEIGYPKNR